MDLICEDQREAVSVSLLWAAWVFIYDHGGGVSVTPSYYLQPSSSQLQVCF